MFPQDSLERLQGVAKDMLEIVDNICRENDITYAICAGTLLGAVRHKGFIPWDDDIDVEMPLEDYKKFVEIAPKCLPEGYTLHTPLNTEGYCKLWVQIFKDGTTYLEESSVQTGCKQGIFIDIFPYIELDEDEALATKQRNTFIKAQRMLYLHYIAHPVIPKNAKFRGLKDFGCALLHHTIAKSWTTEKMLEKVEPYLKPKHGSDRFVNLGSADVTVFNGSDLYPTHPVQFEDLEVMAPCNPDAILTCGYGDYMQLPPENERFRAPVYSLDFGDGIDVMKDLKR